MVMVCWCSRISSCKSETLLHDGPVPLPKKKKIPVEAAECKAAVLVEEEIQQSATVLAADLSGTDLAPSTVL